MAPADVSKEYDSDYAVDVPTRHENSQELHGSSAEIEKNRRGENGFTLLELLVVIAILGLLILLVAPNVMKQFGTAKTNIAKQSIAGLGGVLDMYKLDVGSYPSTEQGLQGLVAAPSGAGNWHGPYVKTDKMLLDPWGHPYSYRFPSERPGQEYDICSNGESGQAGGSDSICNE